MLKCSQSTENLIAIHVALANVALAVKARACVQHPVIIEDDGVTRIEPELNTRVRTIH